MILGDGGIGMDSMVYGRYNQLIFHRSMVYFIGMCLSVKKKHRSTSIRNAFPSKNPSNTHHFSKVFRILFPSFSVINGAPSRSCPAATPGLGFGARPINSTGYHGSRISIQAWCTMFVRHFCSWSFPDHWIRLYLVGGFNLPLWKIMEWKSVGMIIPFPIWWEKIIQMFQSTNQFIMASSNE